MIATSKDGGVFRPWLAVNDTPCPGCRSTADTSACNATVKSEAIDTSHACSYPTLRRMNRPGRTVSIRQPNRLRSSTRCARRSARWAVSAEKNAATAAAAAPNAATIDKKVLSAAGVTRPTVLAGGDAS